MMLNIKDLSFWERNTYMDGVDFLIIGAGIVGCSTALHLRKKYPEAKILVLERSYLPLGASTKNAGFACFGSVTELIDDLTHIPEEEVWATVAKRWKGLNYLKELIGEKQLNFEQYGSWDLINQETDAIPYQQKLGYLNQRIEGITGEKEVYTQDNDSISRFRFKHITTSFKNRLEGQIDTGKMMLHFERLLSENRILKLHGIAVQQAEKEGDFVRVETEIGTLKPKNLIICVNGFAGKFLPMEDVKPARSQVLITKEIPDLHIRGSFHYNMGYYFFRNVGNRILFGGGRNLDFEGETTEQFGTTDLIKSDLERKLKDLILPDTSFEIDFYWSGIMGVGATKKPIVKQIESNIAVGVRMGGMGVAIGSLIGKETADLF